MGATRISDSRTVAIKSIPHGEQELELAQHSAEVGKVDPTGHCVPVLDGFVGDEGAGNFVFLVMPLLKHFNRPDFDTISEVMDFMLLIIYKLKFRCFIRGTVIILFDI